MRPRSRPGPTALAALNLILLCNIRLIAHSLSYHLPLRNTKICPCRILLWTAQGTNWPGPLLSPTSDFIFAQLPCQWIPRTVCARIILHSIPCFFLFTVKVVLAHSIFSFQLESCIFPLSPILQHMLLIYSFFAQSCMEYPSLYHVRTLTSGV